MNIEWKNELLCASKKIFNYFTILRFLLIAFGITDIFAAVYTTSTSVTSQKFTVTARAHWEYTTGAYSGKGTHTITSKPNNGLTIHGLHYAHTHKSNNFDITQYFYPSYYNVIGGNTS